MAVELLGAPGSPYTRKMLALLRYRGIDHRMIWGSHMQPPAGYPVPKVKLLPTFYLGEGDAREAVVDSTPIIRRLEAEHPGRSVLPEDELLGILDLLIEDFADEWMTKMMFHYRWHFAADAANAGPLLIFWQSPTYPDDQAQQMADGFARRQIDRLYVVGSNDITAPIIEASYARLIGILDRAIARTGFVLGTRPSAADFAIYGQLTQLGIVDPTPAAIMARSTPRLRAWLDRVEDLSGLPDGAWLDHDALGDQLGELLTEIGRVYAPFLIANARAAAAGQSDFETEIDGKRWTQPVFPYQAKCLVTLRAARQALSAEARDRLDALLGGTGCEAMFAEEAVA
ncbi:glutathione S-transferase family protein [Blastomonas sp. CCH5-A3]|jgi:glutathione S-transferase|uniref:glutathione S-transferase family protein n=1 Tax=Blastomonas sp. CCH5-A3 TaxID=1768761 RepID=UPI000826BF0A|nr:glutathione S-transferase family protein [Blastomonas sp. CCH5-A3]MAF62617.1 glutathione S-transferase family protein [Blastomonas sp.]|tara:strand:+ start:57793 stop:58818 length:1026 start_codon:yes stop_codon:yes gene_type:complete